MPLDVARSSLDMLVFDPSLCDSERHFSLATLLPSFWSLDVIILDLSALFPFLLNLRQSLLIVRRELRVTSSNIDTLHYWAHEYEHEHEHMMSKHIQSLWKTRDSTFRSLSGSNFFLLHYLDDILDRNTLVPLVWTSVNSSRESLHELKTLTILTTLTLLKMKNK